MNVGTVRLQRSTALARPAPHTGVIAAAAPFDGAGRLLVVSPHLDDAVLSCEAVIGGDRQAEIVTVFTAAPPGDSASAWDTRCGFATSGEAMAARRQEDIAALARTPHRRHELGLREVAYAAPGSRAADAAVLTGWLDRWLANDAVPSIVLLPAATGAHGPRAGAAAAAAWLGQGVWRRVKRLSGNSRPVGGAGVNPDHLWVRDVLARHLARQRTPFLLYEEVPYLWGKRGGATVRRLAADLGMAIERFDLPINTAAKARRVACYRSQVAHLDLRLHPDRLETALPPTERYWRLTPGKAGRD